MRQLTKEGAIAFSNSECYLSWTPRQIAEFQCFQDRLYKLGYENALRMIEKIMSGKHNAGEA